MQKKGMWTRAAEMAELTPPDRNKYVDLLRALSISAVVLGHWIMAAPYLQSGVPQMDHLLDIQPWSRWLTWLFQVMPVFFFVGGFSNGVSWDGIQRRGSTYAAWLESRLRRLLGPVIPLVCFWCVIGAMGFIGGLHSDMIRLGSQIALVPVWFLAIYFVIVMLVPWTRAAWHRFGYASVLLPGVLAIVADWVFINTDHQWLGWFNYFLIWGAVHQLGYAWQAGRLGGLPNSLMLAVVGGVGLVLLTVFGPYPISLVGVPSQEFSNTTPPKLPLLALGITQIGLLLAVEKPARRCLARSRAWTATVLVNGLIMPVFLWHSTVMILLIAGLFLWFPSILLTAPGSVEWWSLRPIWVVTYLAIMVPCLPLFLKLEKLAITSDQSHTSTPVLILGALAICGGLALLANGGVVGGGPFGINWLACLLPVTGALLISFYSRRIPV